MNMDDQAEAREFAIDFKILRGQLGLSRRHIYANHLRQRGLLEHDLQRFEAVDFGHLAPERIRDIKPILEQVWDTILDTAIGRARLQFYYYFCYAENPVARDLDRIAAAYHVNPREAKTWLRYQAVTCHTWAAWWEQEMSEGLFDSD